MILSNNKKKIMVSDFLKELNRKLDNENRYRTSSRQIVLEKLDCKKLAEKLCVTPATISNLNTDSKFSLISDIVDEIHFNYYDLLMVLEQKYNDDKDESEPRFVYDHKELMWELTSLWLKE